MSRTWKVLIFMCVVLLATTMFAAGPAAESSVPQDRPAVSLIPINPDAAAALKAQGRAFKYPFPNSVNQGRKFGSWGGAIGPLTTAPQQDIIVLFAKFTDNPPGGPTTRVDLANFDDLLFGTEYKPAYWELLKTYGIDYPTDRTLYNYYKTVSYGAVSVGTFDPPSTVGWIDVGHPYNYYFGDHCNGQCGNPPGVINLVIDTLNIAKTQIDFSKYAGADGVVPNIFVVVAGTGAEWSGTPDLMWSHSWSISWVTGGAGLNVGTEADPVYVNHYAMMPEVGGDLTGFTGEAYGPYPATVGVYAHEYAHVLGVPDQYDYGYESEGTGQYSLMAGGSWGVYPRYLDYYGNSPSLLDAWSRYRLGFVNPTIATAGDSLNLRPAEVYPDVIRIDVPNSGGKEYYLLENRQPIGFDKTLWRCTVRDGGAFAELCSYYGGTNAGAHGLAIYHIDDVKLSERYWRPNEQENWNEFRSLGFKHYGISLIQADDQWSLEHGYNQGDRGDLFPGVYNVHMFGTYTFPNTSSYYFWGGSLPKFGYSGVDLSNIEEAEDGSVTLNVGFLPWLQNGR